MSAFKSVTLPADAIPDLRRALAFGLHAVAEVNKVTNAIGIMRMSGDEPPESLIPLGNGSDVTSDFASALLWLDTAQEVTP